MMLKSARWYFKHGWLVIPSKDKKALVSGWGKDGNLVIDEQQVERWWSNEFKEANISVLCGNQSNLIVLDTDSQDAEDRVCNLLPTGFACPTSQTPKGGKHRFFAYQTGFASRRYTDGLDIKTDGGLAVVPPSINARGKYKWLIKPTDIKPPPLPDNLVKFLKKLHKDHLKPQGLQKTTEAVIKFKKGFRNESLFHIATCLQRGGMQYNNINNLLFYIGNHICEPQLSKQEIEEIYKSAVLKKERNIASEVYEWVTTTSGHFSTTDNHKELQLTTKQEKKAANMALLRLVDKGVIEKYGRKSGVYRRIESDFIVLDPFSKTCQPMDIKFPFGEHNLVNVYGKNTIILSGARNAGKTCYCLNFSLLNMRFHRIWYMSSEMGVGELQVRLAKFKDIQWPIIPAHSDKPGITFVERGSEWQDIVKPNAINIIDYMELHDDFWRVGGLIRKIFDKLENGIALICLQKKAGDKTHYGRGGEFSLENPRLALAMDKGKCQIVKAKNVKERVRDPEGRTIRFKISNGADIEPETDWI